MHMNRHLGLNYQDSYFKDSTGKYKWLKPNDLQDYDFYPEIYDYFKKEYDRSELFYQAFIESKDLGLVTAVTKVNERDYGHSIHSDYYMIVDEKKWMLAKIKYEI